MAVSSNSPYNIGQILIENFEDLIIILNENYKCEYINEKTHQEQLGYSCLKKNITDFIYYNDIKQTIKFLQRILKIGRAVEHIRFRIKSTYGYFEVKGRRFSDDNKSLKILLILRNISNFKEIENEWAEREKRLKELAESLPEIRFWKLLQPRDGKEAFHKTREMLDLVIDNIPQLIFWKDKNLKYLGCNQKFASINNIDDPALIVNMTDQELNWPKTNLSQIQRSERQVIQDDKSESLIESWILPNKEKTWFEINRIPLHDYKNEVMGVLSTYNDITEHIISGQKLRESEEKYRSILENIQEGYYEVDLDGAFTFFNESLCNITGYLRHELLGMNYKDITDDKSRETIYEIFNNVYKTGIGQTYSQFEFFNKDKEKVYIDTSVYLRTDSEGKKLGFYGIVRDISDKYTLEQKLKQSEEKYRLISENAYDLISILNQDLKFEYANNQPWMSTLGYTSEEIVNESVLSFVHPEDKKRSIKAMVDGLEKGQAFLETRIRHKDGRWVWIEVKGNVFTDKDGNIKGILMGRDITERKVAEQKIKDSEERYHSIFSASPDIIYLTDLEGNFLDVNQVFLEKSKMKMEEVRGRNFIEFFAGENPGELLKGINELREGRAIEGLEISAKNALGEINDYEINAVPLKEGGKIAKILSFAREITSRKQAEIRLKNSEKKYRHLFESSPFTIWLIDKDGKIIDCNSTMNKLLSKYTKDDIISKNYMNVLSLFERPEHFIPFFKTRFDSFTKGGILEPVEFQITRADEKKLWLTIQSSRIKLGEEVLIQVIIQDITEKKEATLKLQKSEEELRLLNKKLEQIVFERTKELRESEEKFRTIAEQSSLGIAILQDGYLVYTNQALSEITGFENKEISKWTQNEFVKQIHPDDLSYVLGKLQKKMEGDIEHMSHYSCRIITKSKELRWIELHSKAITYQGKIADFITFIDITDKKIAQEKLIESEEKYRHLYENSPYSIVLLNYNGEIIDINSTTPKLFGYNKEDLVGKNYQDLFNIYPEDTWSALREIPDLLSKGEPIKPVVKPQIIKIYDKEGKSLWVESELSTIKLGEELITQLIIQDITEKKIAEEKLKESERILRHQNIELKELDRLKTDFISIAAHELKTPLISVGGYVDLILLRDKDSLLPEIKDDLQRVLNNVHRLEDYINRLMDVMKIDAKKMDLILKKENIYNIIENSITNLEFQINQKDIKFELNIDKNLILEVDSYRISQVFSNILSNAVKFTSDEGLIQVSADKQEDGYVFHIKDNGKGLTKDEIEKLFGKFVSLDRSTENFSKFEKGTGLGLYITKGIIETHGGKIWVESKGKDKGAEFSFLLPIRQNKS